MGFGCLVAWKMVVLMKFWGAGVRRGGWCGGAVVDGDFEKFALSLVILNIGF